MLAFALRADGWYLRQDIIWHKPNPMPESVRDRCTKAHEYIFLLSKADKYYYDHEAVKVEASQATLDRNKYGFKGAFKGQFLGSPVEKRWQEGRPIETPEFSKDGKANRRSVWTVATKPYKGAHFATFPTQLIEPCILAGSRPNDIVLDPFMGSGTTAAVAIQHGRQYLGCELNPEYGELQQQRLQMQIKPKKAVTVNRCTKTYDLFGETYDV
jgi:DNA modification methylase